MARFKRQFTRRQLTRPGLYSLSRNAIQAATRVGSRYLSSRVLTARRQTSNAPVPVTGEHDFKTDYRYKRMPKRRRRRWVRFQRKVDFISAKKLGLKQYVVTSNGWFGMAENQSNGVSFELYPADGVAGYKDLGDICRGVVGALPFDNSNNTGASNISLDKRIQFESANMEVTIRNTGENTAIVESYQFICRKDVLQLNDGSYNNVFGQYRQSFIKTSLITDPDGTSNTIPLSTIPTYLSTGTTPFQANRFCSYFKILKRQKFTIPPGGQIQLSLRNARTKFLNVGGVRSRNALRGWTQGFLIQGQGVPGPVEGTSVGALPAQLHWYSVRRYSYYLPASGFDQDAFNMNT